MIETITVISDTGPLSYLHRLRRLDILHRFYGRVLVPPAVVAELNVGIRLGLDLPDITTLPWIVMQTPSANALAGIDGLGGGETEGIALARELPNALLLLDDGRARRIASALGLRISGTIGVLLVAKQKGLIGHLEPELDRLEGFGFRLAAPVRLAVLQKAGEAE
jgi:uncharacterized protein